MNNELFIIHKDWEGLCIITKNIIFRKDYSNEKGTFIINDTKITIKWDKWDYEEFYRMEDINIYYLKSIYDEIKDSFYIFDKSQMILISVNKKTNIFRHSSNISGKYKIINNTLVLYSKNIEKVYEYYTNNVYYVTDKEDYLFKLNINDDNNSEDYIFNKLSKKFYNLNNFDVHGTYEAIDNSIYLKWYNGIKKVFYTNRYSSQSKISNNINIIKPVNILINDYVLFSNISLCKNKIILTSLYYKLNPFDLNELKISIKNRKILKKSIYENDDYESSLSIILELEEIYNDLYINIIYKNLINKDLYLEQLNITDHNISAMTLFKDDYKLLENYLSYYSKFDIEVFYLYYNDKITDNLIEYISKISKNIKIYLIEWNYKYWWNYDKDSKHHHAQTMALNDSFNILKNYSNYVLYNDLDEYFILDNYSNFNELIKDNSTVDIFIWKNRFCKMGDELIKYKDFNINFDLSKIIKGNYWDKGREKFIVKLENINVIGVHGYFARFNNKVINEKTNGEFYHILNFEEKYRENLMWEYIS
jgi:hypothetical protein